MDRLSVDRLPATEFQWAESKKVGGFDDDVSRMDTRTHMISYGWAISDLAVVPFYGWLLHV